MTHRASCRLPKKPSKLIELALDDLAKAERTKGYKIDMGTWHDAPDAEDQYDPMTCKAKKKEEPCTVCLAGSVMAFSLNVPRTLSIEPFQFADEVQSALNAINAFREGDIWRGLDDMDIPDATKQKAGDLFGIPEFDQVKVVAYERDRAKFKRQMRDMAKKLASIGL